MNPKKKIRFSKKAQSAMEFLMTYGWAIMAFVIAVTALFLYGPNVMKSPSQESCVLSSGFSCSEFVIGSDGIKLVLNNGIGNDLNYVIVSATNLQQGICSDSTPQNIRDGSHATITLSCTNLVVNKKIITDLKLEYTLSGSTLSKTSHGKIAGQVKNIQVSGQQQPGGGADTTSPTASNLNTSLSTIYKGNVTLFSGTWSDNINLSTYVLSINQGSGYVNQTIKEFGLSSNVSTATVTITASAGTVVNWLFYAYDGSRNLGASSVNQFTVHGCSGTPNSCDSFYDSSCSAQLICNWVFNDETQTEECLGTARACTLFTTQNSCINQLGCTWS